MKILKIGILAAALGVMACGDSSTTPTDTGSLRVMLKDSPFADAKAVLVTFTEVSAHLGGGDFQTLAFADSASSRTCDLKKLTSAQDVLGVGPLAKGHYTELRLEVSSARLYFDNASAGSACAPSIEPPAGAVASLTIPSGTVRLNREFDVATGTTTTILLDFDGDTSIVRTGIGSYIMTPVISIVSVE